MLVAAVTIQDLKIGDMLDARRMATEGRSAGETLWDRLCTVREICLEDGTVRLSFEMSDASKDEEWCSFDDLQIAEIVREESPEIKQFEVGKTYSCRSICNHDSVWTYTIASRTASTITTVCGKTMRISKKISQYFGAETVYPQGRFSMAPTLTAEVSATQVARK